MKLMSDVSVLSITTPDVTSTNSEIDYKAWYEENLDKVASFDSVVAKKDQLLKEVKQTKSEREAAKQEAARVAEEKAKKDGDWDKLLANSKEREESLAKELESIKYTNRQERVNNAALRIASNLAEGENVELLSDFIGRNLDKLADDTGVLSADVLKEVQEDFANNTKYKSLLRGSKATGGGATGNTRSATQASIMKRADFDQLDQYSRGQFFTNGGKLTD